MERLSSQILILFCILVCGVAVKAQNADHPLTLKEAVDMARASNPSLLSVRKTIDMAQAQVKTTIASLLPTVNLVTTSAYKRDPLNTPFHLYDVPYNQYESSLNLTQPLFAIGTFAAVDSAQKTRDIDKLNDEISTRNLTNQVIDAYYNVVLQTRNVDTLLRQLQIERETLAVTEHREHTGRSQLLDVLQAKTQVALLEPQIASAQNALEVAAATMSNLLGDAKTKVYRVNAGLDGPPLSVVDQHIDLQHFYLPELKQAELSIEQVDDQKRVMLGENLPSLTAAGGYNFTSYEKSTLFDSSSVSWDIGLQLTIPIFSGLSSLYQQQQLSAERTELEFNRVNTQNLLTLQQVTNRKNLETAQQSIISGEKAFELAKASSKEARRQYRLATIDLVQFLQIETTYVQSEQSLNSAKYSFIQALGNYYVASGQNLDGLVALLEEVNR